MINPTETQHKQSTLHVREATVSAVRRQRGWRAEQACPAWAATVGCIADTTYGQGPTQQNMIHRWYNVASRSLTRMQESKLGRSDNKEALPKQMPCPEGTKPRGQSARATRHTSNRWQRWCKLMQVLVRQLHWTRC